MDIDLNQCSNSCLECVKNNIKKHDLRPGRGGFKIACKGIPKAYLHASIMESLNEKERTQALATLDPVLWAAECLDWHCLDPDGEVWKRKNQNEYWDWVNSHPGEEILGHSRYHRPYQAEMLRCTSKRKVFRIGRQSGKTESLVISMLFSMVTKPNVPDNEGFKIVVITPYQSQIDLIFTRIKQLISGSAILQNSVKRSVKAPTYTLELHNGSTVRGFTAGTKSGGNAEAVRGQAANMLVFDEADYLSAGDMDAAMAIISNYPDATVWMSSTPSGKREMFFKNCSSKGWKEFHFPSSSNPLWNEELETVFREALTELGYIHECDAEFGEQEQGVFQNAYVQAAKAEYKYGDFSYQRSWTYTLGVDWNDTKNGTTINVLGFNPRENIFYIVDRKVIQRDGWTQTTACEKVRDLNRIWRPIAIYIDKGHGGTQDEILRKYGYDAVADPTRGIMHPDSALKDIVKMYDFGSNIEINDYVTRQPVKKYAKGFLVEQTVRRFESNDIRFPETDESLEAQLNGYIIDRVTPAGNPVYKADNESVGDHALDALMLSVVAFIKEVTPLGKPKFSADITFSGNIGESSEMPIHEGDLVIKADKRVNTKEHRDKVRPSSRDVQPQTLFDQSRSIPANHTDIHKPKLWSNDGFFRDEPNRQIRSLSDLDKRNTKRTGLSPVRGSRPRRKNI